MWSPQGGQQGEGALACLPWAPLATEHLLALASAGLPRPHKQHSRGKATGSLACRSSLSPGDRAAEKLTPTPAPGLRALATHGVQRLSHLRQVQLQALAGDGLARRGLIQVQVKDSRQGRLCGPGLGQLFPSFWEKIFSKVTSPRSSRYFCMTLRMLEDSGGGGDPEPPWLLPGLLPEILIIFPHVRIFLSNSG